MPRYKDLTGQVFHKLTAIEYAGPNKAGAARWLWRCECGNEKVLDAAEVKRGKSRSCGCLQLEQRRQASRSRCHEYSRSNWRREYRSWEGMIRRCTDPKWPKFCDYGARGITVCDEWMGSFRAFAEAMGRAPEGYTLDRIDNSRGYSPDNCRWANYNEQANNRRSNRLLTHNGMTMNVTQWASEIGVSRALLYQRLHKGWPVERVLAA